MKGRPPKSKEDTRHYYSYVLRFNKEEKSRLEEMCNMFGMSRSRLIHYFLWLGYKSITKNKGEN